MLSAMREGRDVWPGYEILQTKRRVHQIFQSPLDTQRGKSIKGMDLVDSILPHGTEARWVSIAIFSPSSTSGAEAIGLATTAIQFADVG